MPTLEVNHKIVDAMQSDRPIVVVVGGRGSGKSLGVGDYLVFEMAAMNYSIYCLREFQDSITDSVHKVIKSAVEDRVKLDGWEIQQNSVIAPGGAKTVYKGANRNPDAMQSAQGYMRSWFEEAHRASQASLDKLLPTILRNPGAKCIFTANPQSSSDPFSQRFIVPYQEALMRDGYYEDDLHYIVSVNWRDNPWWNEEQERLRQWDYKHLSRAKYDWIWEGAFMDEVEDSIILPEWFDAAIDAHEKLGFKARGKRVVSFDPADTGDAKGLSLRHGSIFLDILQSQEGDVNTSCDWATDYAIAKGANTFVWDADGLGLTLRRQVSDGLKG
ncbi:MAG TPA: PBSX family phage terminase large subunit, partial [Candidatus Obscuribacterales bacterium]